MNIMIGLPVMMIAGTLHAEWVSPASVQRPGKDILFVDVRLPDYYRARRIKGAINEPSAGMEKAALPQDKTLILYCSSKGCPLSENSAVILNRRGYTNVKVLKGGIEAWQAAGLPMESDSQAQKRLEQAQRAATPASSIPLDQVKTKIDNGLIQLADVRPSVEFRSGHLPHALSLPLEELDHKLCVLSKGQEILVYDRISSRGAQAAQRLMGEGFAVRVLEGGVTLWASKGYPLAVKEEEDLPCRN